MRKAIERWVNGEPNREDFKKDIILELLEIDWLDKRRITYMGKVILDGSNPIPQELKHLSFNSEELESADQLLIAIIKGSYRFDTSPGTTYSNKVLYQHTNNAFRPFPKRFYEQAGLGTSTPWLKRKLMMDLYIYSKLASGKIWEDWSHSKYGKDKYLLHKPASLAPFSVVFKEEYLWENIQQKD